MSFLCVTLQMSQLNGFFPFINRHQGLYCGLYWFRWWVPQKSGHWKWLHRFLVCGHTHTPGALSETWHCIWLETRTCLCDDRQESVKGMFYYDILRSCFYYILLFLLFSLVFYWFATKRFNYCRKNWLFIFLPSIIVHLSRIYSFLLRNIFMQFYMQFLLSLKIFFGHNL